MAEMSSSYRIGFNPCRLKASVKRDFAVCTNLLQVILDVKKPHQVNISEWNFVARQRQRQRIPLLTIIPQFRSTHARYIHTHVDLSPWSYAQKISPHADDVNANDKHQGTIREQLTTTAHTQPRRLFDMSTNTTERWTTFQITQATSAYILETKAGETATLRQKNSANRA